MTININGWNFENTNTYYEFTGTRTEFNRFTDIINTSEYRERIDIGYSDMLFSVDETGGFNFKEFAGCHFAEMLKEY